MEEEWSGASPTPPLEGRPFQGLRPLSSVDFSPDYLGECLVSMFRKAGILDKELDVNDDPFLEVDEHMELDRLTE